MTSVYGVTYSGARDQIKRRLKERSAFSDEKESFGAACYAAKVYWQQMKVLTLENLIWHFRSSDLQRRASEND